eukprot:6527393-Alexandrium_andersonii.AAC.1
MSNTFASILCICVSAFRHRLPRRGTLAIARRVLRVSGPTHWPAFCHICRDCVHSDTGCLTGARSRSHVTHVCVSRPTLNKHPALLRRQRPDTGSHGGTHSCRAVAKMRTR